MNRSTCLFVVLLVLSACAAPAPSLAPPSPQPSFAGCTIALERKDPPLLSKEAQAQGLLQRWSPVSGDAFKEDGATVTYAGAKVSFDKEGYTAQMGSQTVTTKAAKGDSIELAVSCGNVTLRVFLRYTGNHWELLEYLKGSQA